MKALLWVLPCLAALFGCATASQNRAELAQRAQSELVGMSKTDLLSCAGAPLRSEKAGEVEVLTYVGGGDLVGGPDFAQRRYCEVSFVMRMGRVDKINYAGRTGGLITKGEQCAFVVENCMRSK